MRRGAFPTSKCVGCRPDWQVIKRAIDLIIRANSEIGRELRGSLNIELREKFSNKRAVSKHGPPG